MRIRPSGSTSRSTADGRRRARIEDSRWGGRRRRRHRRGLRARGGGPHRWVGRQRHRPARRAAPAGPDAARRLCAWGRPRDLCHVGCVLRHAPEATIRQYRAVDAWGFGSSWRLKDCIKQAVQDGRQVINISLGFEDPGFDRFARHLGRAARRAEFCGRGGGRWQLRHGDPDAASLAHEGGRRQGLEGVISTRWPGPTTARGWISVPWPCRS